MPWNENVERRGFDMAYAETALCWNVCVTVLPHWNNGGSSISPARSRTCLIIKKSLKRKEWLIYCSLARTKEKLSLDHVLRKIGIPIVLRSL